jgi:hypothetical protein
MSDNEMTPLQWTDEQYAAYELGMQTEREHQNRLSRLVMEKHEAVLAQCRQELAAANASLQAIADFQGMMGMESEGDR